MNLVAELDLFNKSTILQVTIQIIALSISVLLDLSPQSMSGVFGYSVSHGWEKSDIPQRVSDFEGVCTALQWIFVKCVCYTSYYEIKKCCDSS